MKPVAHAVRKVPVMIVLACVDVIGGERTQRVEDHRETLALLGRELREGEDELLADLAQEEPLDERRVFVGSGEMRLRGSGRCWGGDVGHGVSPGVTIPELPSPRMLSKRRRRVTASDRSAECAHALS